MARHVALFAVTVALAFAGGAVARLTFRAEASAISVKEGVAEAGRDEMVGVLVDRYFRPLDQETLANADLAALPTLLDDVYTHFMTRSEYLQYMADETADTVGIGIDVTGEPGGLRITRVFPNSPAAAGWLLAGDLVTAIDGTSLAGLTVKEGLAVLKGGAGSVAAVTIDRRDSALLAHVTRRPAHEWMVDAELRVVDGRRVGYIALLDFSEGSSELVAAATSSLVASGAEALVLDLRGNPGGWAREAVGVASVFLPEGTPVLVERSTHFDDTVYSTHTPPVNTTLPLAVLVDHGSASSAEIVAGALRDDGRGVLVGATTFGKGRIQDIAVLATGGALKLTVAEYLTPNRVAVDRVGLTPDIAVTDSPAAGDDAAFTRAVTRITS